MAIVVAAITREDRQGTCALNSEQRDARVNNKICAHSNYHFAQILPTNNTNSGKYDYIFAQNLLF